ncbi:tau 95 subunit of transcription factor TFIIIC [Lecanora helva]
MPFMQKMQEHILPFDYEKLKGFTFDMSKGVKPNAEIIPPPQMTHFRHPFNYSYHQNPSVKPVADQFGNITMSNVHGSVKVFGQPVPPDIHEVPSAPAHELLPFESLEASLKGLIASARRLLEDRPIFTRKALLNSIPDIDSDSTSTNFVKRMYQYCGYSFSSGPWRDAIVRFGVDPRKDPGCRIYQTMMFMLENEPKDSRAKYNRRPADHAAAQEGPRKESHLFDGKTVSKNGKTWQVCDISDPFLSRLLATTDLRQECDIENDGWYQNGTWAKAKIIMKAKIQAILSNEPQDEAVYITVANRLPDVIRPKDTPYTKQYENATGYEVQLASHIRRASAPERILAQNGDNDGDDDKEESDSVASSPTSQDRAIDPRLTAMASSTLGEGIAPPEEVSDGMDIDTPLNESIPTPYEMAL